MCTRWAEAMNTGRIEWTPNCAFRRLGCSHGIVPGRSTRDAQRQALFRRHRFAGDFRR